MQQSEKPKVDSKKSSKPAFNNSQTRIPSSQKSGKSDEETIFTMDEDYSDEAESSENEINNPSLYNADSDLHFPNTTLTKPVTTKYPGQTLFSSQRKESPPIRIPIPPTAPPFKDQDVEPLALSLPSGSLA